MNHFAVTSVPNRLNLPCDMKASARSVRLWTSMHSVSRHGLVANAMHEGAVVAVPRPGGPTRCQRQECLTMAGAPPCVLAADPRSPAFVLCAHPVTGVLMYQVGLASPFSIQWLARAVGRGPSINR